MKFNGTCVDVMSKIYEILSLDSRPPMSYNSFVYETDDEMFRRVIDTVRAKKEEIVNSFTFRSDKWEATKFIFSLLTLAPRSRLLLRNPPEEFYKWLSETVKSDLRGSELPLLPDDLTDKFSRYSVVFINDGVRYLNPTQREVLEVERLTSESYNMIVSRSVYHFYSNEMRYDRITKSFLLGGRVVYKLTEDEDEVDIILSDNVTRGVRMAVVRSLLDCMKEEVLGISSIDVVDVKTSYRSVKIVFNIRNNTRFGNSVTLDYSLTNNGMLKMVLPTTFHEETVKVSDVLPFKKIFDVKSVLNLLLDELSSKLEVYRTIYDSQIVGSTRINGVGVETTVYDKPDGHVTIQVKMEYGKPIDILFFKDKISLYGIEVSCSTSEYSTQATMNYVVKSDEKIPHVLERVKSERKLVLNTIIEASKQYEERLRRIKEEEEKLSDTSNLLASYILFVTHPELSRFEMDYLKERMYEYLSKLDGMNWLTDKHSVITSYDRVLSRLVTEGVIRVDTNSVILNGRRLHEFLVDLGYDEPTSIMIEKDASSKIIESLILLPLEELLKEQYNGKTYWSLLPENVKKKYPNMISIDDTIRILED